MTENQLRIMREAAKTNKALAETMEALGPERALKVWKVRRNLKAKIEARKLSQVDPQRPLIA